MRVQVSLVRFAAFLMICSLFAGFGFAAELRAIRGEVVPKMLNPNMLPNGNFEQGLSGWTLEGDGSAEVIQTEAGPVLKIEKHGGDAVRLISDRLPARPGATYQFTGLYSTQNASFGNMADFSLVAITNPNQPENRDVPAWRPSYSGLLGHRSMFNSPPDDWRRKTRLFTVSDQARFVRLVFTLEGPAATVYLADLYLSPPGEGSRFWMQPASEVPTRISELMRWMTTGRRKLDERPDSSSVVRTENGIPKLYVDGKPVVPQIHMGDVSNPARSYFKEFGDHNLNIHIVSLFNESRRHWYGYKQYNLELVDTILWDAIVRDPEGYFIVNINVLPYPEWHEEFPEHAAQNSAGEYTTSRHDRYAPPDYWSDEYREQVYHLIESYVRHIHSQPYGKAVIGYFITGGEDGQFYWQVSRGQRTIQDGNAPGSLPLFRRWIRQRYSTEEELRQAWNDPTLTFENVRPPIKNEKYPGTFLDPVRNRKEVDFLIYLNEELANFLLETARIVKETSPKEVIVGAYYGRGTSLLVYPLHAQTNVMLRSDLLDFMGAQPGYYGWRDAGSEGHLNWVFDSVRSHGKIMMSEFDFRTWKGSFKSLEHDYSVARFWNMDDFVGAAARDLGKLLSITGGAWWMEMTGGWFHDDDIMAEIGKLHDISQELYEEDFTISPGDILFVADEESFFWTVEQINSYNGANLHSLNTQQRAINRAGVRYDLCYWPDLLEKEMDDYKVYVFLNTYYLTDQKREFIETRLKRDGKILMWQYAPGYLTPTGFSLESMAELTGIRLKSDSGSLKSRFAILGDSPAETVKALLKGVEGQTVGLGLVPAIQRFYVDDPTAEALAYYDDGKVAAAVKQTDSYTSIYIGHPSGLTPQFIANVVDRAGGHTYVEPGDLFMYHRDDFIVMHGVEGGQRLLRLPFEARVTELLKGEVLAEKASEIPLELRPTQTIWLKIER